MPVGSRQDGVDVPSLAHWDEDRPLTQVEISHHLDRYQTQVTVAIVRPRAHFAAMLSLADIQRAREQIADAIYLSPLARSESLSQRTGNTVFLKLENLQMTGSFKERGAQYRMQALSGVERQAGIIASSAGNHAQAVAYVAQQLGIRATIVMPVHAPLTKLVNTRGYGAEVILAGETYADAYAVACEHQSESGQVFVHPFDHQMVMAGQGTIGLELLEQQPDLDAIIAPVGGGGLIGGIAVAIKEQAPHIEVIGVEAENFSSASRSLSAGQVTADAGIGSLADGIAVKQIGDITFPVLERYVDRMVTVSEDQIAGAILALVESEKTVAEGAGAVSLAALLDGAAGLQGKRVAVLVSGGNIDVNLLSQIIERGLTRDGRRIRLAVQVPDRPGSLAQLTSIVAEVGANVLEVIHERAFAAGPVGTTMVRLTLETRGQTHVAEVTRRLDSEGFSVRYSGRSAADPS